MSQIIAQNGAKMMRLQVARLVVAGSLETIGTDFGLYSLCGRDFAIKLRIDCRPVESFDLLQKVLQVNGGRRRN